MNKRRSQRKKCVSIMLKFVQALVKVSQLRKEGERVERNLKEELCASLPRLSSSWWVWWGGWDPGTPGDSCYGTYHTLAAAATATEAKSEIRSFKYRMRQH